MPMLATVHGIAIAVALVCATQSAAPAAPVSRSTGEETELATSSLHDGPIRLGAEPSHIRLSDDALENVAKWVRGAGGAGRIYLVLDQIRAKRQPGVLYEVFVSATDGGPQTPDSAHLVGHFNLFERQQPFLSFDVTERVEGLDLRGRKLVVTIQPAVGLGSSGRPEFRQELEQAEVTVGRVRLVAQ